MHCLSSRHSHKGFLSGFFLFVLTLHYPCCTYDLVKTSRPIKAFEEITGVCSPRPAFSQDVVIYIGNKAATF